MNEVFHNAKETTQVVGNTKAITPLWIIALFLSLTETMLGVAVTQTVGAIQIALTTFVIVFPLIIAGAFFIILWFKNYVLFPPEVFNRMDVNAYVKAMQHREPDISGFSLNNQNVQQLTKKELIITEESIDLFIERIDFNGLLCLYVFSLVNKTMIPLNTDTLAVDIELDYAWGTLTAATAIALIDYTSSKRVVNIIYINERLKDRLPTEIDRRVKNLDKTDVEFIQNKIKQIERYYG